MHTEIKAIMKRRDTTFEMPLSYLQKDGYAEVRLERSAIPADVRSVDFMTGLLEADTGDTGYMVVPVSLSSPRSGSQLCKYLERADTQQVFIYPLMPIYGMVRGGTATLVIIEGMPLDFNIVLGVREGRYYLYARFEFSELPPYEDIAARIITLTGAAASYSGMARAYREYQLGRGACKPVSELLGEHFCSAFQRIKAHELAAYEGVISSWERDHLLLKV